jgi:hypothetical protein
MGFQEGPFLSNSGNWILVYPLFNNIGILLLIIITGNILLKFTLLNQTSDPIVILDHPPGTRSHHLKIVLRGSWLFKWDSQHRHVHMTS